jgi:hypothetical protein
MVVVAVWATPERAATPKFFPDDPIQIDNDTSLDASKAMTIEDSNYYDFASNTFLTPGETNDSPAVNVNTIDEVPDSSWFTNRIGRAPIPMDAFVRGPDGLDSVSIDERWTIVQGKSTGLQPGFRMADPTGQLYQLEFDPPSNPELATSAEMIGTVFYHALGYNVVDVYFVEIDPQKLRIAPTATIRDLRTGERRRFRQTDLFDVLDHAARQSNGTYRALASRFAEGRQVGSFRYYGTRPDDPNDIFPHEDRRELRGNRVFAAWLNHDDSRGLNSLDMLVGADRKYIKHYMFDFGSIMGSGTVRAQTPRAGNEYILDWKAGFLTMATLGLYVRPWLTIDYPGGPDSVGNFEGDAFDPETWKPEYPNPAFRNMQPEDAFWAARLVAKFTPEMIRAAVEKGRYSDPRATEYITQTLIKRRDKVLRVFLNRVNPVVDPQLSADGVLTFRNAAVDAGVATPASSYAVGWSRFDNATGAHTWVGDTALTETSGQAPKEVLQGTEFVAVLIRGLHPQQARWLRPTRVYFRRDGAGWKTVGIDRAVYREKDQLGLAPMSPTRRY